MNPDDLNDLSRGMRLVAEEYRRGSVPNRDNRAHVLGEQVQVIASEIIRHIGEVHGLVPDGVIVAEAIRAATAIVLAEQRDDTNRSQNGKKRQT